MNTTDDNNEQQCGDSGEEMTSKKEKCTSCEQSIVDNITKGINSDAILDDKSTCANCGKVGSDVNNVCNKCKMVKYCNAACKKKHRHKHKKDCEEHLRLAVELHDEELFKQPTRLGPHGDCPICFIRLPMHSSGGAYQPCCGKVVCNGCFYSPVYDNQGNEVDNKKCPFCRTPRAKSTAEAIEMSNKRVKAGDPIAIQSLGNDYREGRNGCPQDMDKAIELWHRAGKLGYAQAHCNIGVAYMRGIGVEVDEKKAVHYYEQAAMQGDVVARFNLGNTEKRAGNMDRALKHYMIAIRGGYSDSLEQIKELYTDEHVTKEDYTKALQSYQAYLEEIKSAQRDEAAAADEGYRYY